MNPTASCGVWEVTIYGCRLTYYEKIALLLCKMLTTEDAPSIKVKTTCIWELSVFSAHFCCESTAAVEKE